jgi:hypothetical protein
MATKKKKVTKRKTASKKGDIKRRKPTKQKLSKTAKVRKKVKHTTRKKVSSKRKISKTRRASESSVKRSRSITKAKRKRKSAVKAKKAKKSTTKRKTTKKQYIRASRKGEPSEQISPTAIISPAPQKFEELEDFEPLPEEPGEVPETEEPEVKIYHRQTGDSRGFTEDIPEAPQTYLNSSHANIHAPREDTLAKIFENTIKGFKSKTPFELNELNIYRHGVIFRPAHGIWSDRIESSLQKILEDFPGSSMHVTHEEDTFSVKLNFGDPTIPGSFTETIASFEDIAEAVRRSYDELIDFGFDDIDWFVFFDTEEDLKYDE